MNDINAHFVSYRRHEDDRFTSTNIVHARSMANIDREFDDCAWYSIRWAPEAEVKAARAKGMPERWL